MLLQEELQRCTFARDCAWCQMPIRVGALARRDHHVRARARILVPKRSIANVLPSHTQDKPTGVLVGALWAKTASPSLSPALFSLQCLLRCVLPLALKVALRGRAHCTATSLNCSLICCGPWPRRFLPSARVHSMGSATLFPMPLHCEDAFKYTKRFGVFEGAHWALATTPAPSHNS